MYTGTYLTEKKFIREIDKNYNYNDKRTAMVAVINLMNDYDAERLWNEINELIDFKNTLVGKYVFEKENEPKDLLHKFWQEESDSCPLEATEAEKQETGFNDWVLNQYKEIEFPI